MRRRVRPVPFARLRVDSLKGTLTHAAPTKWPPHLQLAYAILQEECKLPAPTARDILKSSAARALECAQALDQRALSLSRYKTTDKVRKSFSRLAACAARAPAAPRNALDEKIHAIFPEIIDTEVIEAIMDAAYAIFACSKLKVSGTALRALLVSDRDDEKIIGLKAEYSALDFAARRRCEAAVSSHPRESVPGTAVAIFKALTAAIEKGPPDGMSAEASDLIVTYVLAVARRWQQNGLHPSRATHPKNRKYRSRFHRFVEFVLTAVTEPGSHRHSPGIDEVARQLWANRARVPAEMRSKISKELRREDREWLVSEDHVRKALRLLTRKTGQDTP
jgi:hypothetical protein